MASVTDDVALRRDDDRGLFSHLDLSMGIHPGPCTAASGDIGIDGAQAGALIQARRSLPHPRGSMGAIGQIERDLLSGNHARQLRRSEEHTSELQSLMRNSYAVFCLKKKKYRLEATNHEP